MFANSKMMLPMLALALSSATALTSGAALAQEKLKVGVMVTLSGPPAALGQQVRDGFQLAVKQLGGKLGGVDAEVVVVDDELKPDVAVGKVKGLLERDKVQFVVGPIFSNILQAIHKPVTDSNAFLVCPNAGTSNFAGSSRGTVGLFVSMLTKGSIGSSWMTGLSSMRRASSGSGGAGPSSRRPRASFRIQTNAT